MVRKGVANCQFFLQRRTREGCCLGQRLRSTRCVLLHCYTPLFARVSLVALAVSSARRMVVTPTAVSLASCSALQRMSARAALIWALVKGLGDILTSPQVMHI